MTIQSLPPRALRSLCGVATVLFYLGCSSWAWHGGAVVSEDDLTTVEHLVDYRTEGTVPDGASYHLVRTPRGVAILEHAPDGGGTLFENHWVDEAGDHYAGWVYFPGGGDGQHAWEFVVPKDRAGEALRYAYAGGTYEVKEIDGVKRPIPDEPVEPVTRLIPVR